MQKHLANIKILFREKNKNKKQMEQVEKQKIKRWKQNHNKFTMYMLKH